MSPLNYGKGFEVSSLYRYVQFYKTYNDIFATPRQESLLSWSHYKVLLQINDKNARKWFIVYKIAKKYSNSLSVKESG